MTDKEKLDKIRELIKPFRRWWNQSDDYACAKNERQRQKILNNGGNRINASRRKFKNN